MKNVIKPRKLCKTCGVKPRYANVSFCWVCYCKREKEKRELKAEKKKLRKEGTKKFQKSLMKKLHNKAWRLQSKWIRTKDANMDGYVECYTCDTAKHYKEMDAGHFKHGRLDFDDRNLKPQCTKCNRYYSGRLDVYASRLIEEYGLEWFKQLERDATRYNKYDSERLKEIIIDLNEKLLRLRKKELLTPYKIK